MWPTVVVLCLLQFVILCHPCGGTWHYQVKIDGTRDGFEYVLVPAVTRWRPLEQTGRKICRWSSTSLLCSAASRTQLSSLPALANHITETVALEACWINPPLSDATSQWQTTRNHWLMNWTEATASKAPTWRYKDQGVFNRCAFCFCQFDDVVGRRYEERRTREMLRNVIRFYKRRTYTCTCSMLVNKYRTWTYTAYIAHTSSKIATNVSSASLQIDGRHVFTLYTRKNIANLIITIYWSTKFDLYANDDNV